MRTLVLMACSARKIGTGRIGMDGREIGRPLYELYDGPVWQTLRTHKPDAIAWGDVYVLSGKFGFVSSFTHATPYEEKISAKKVDAAIARGLDGLERHPKKGHVIGMTLRATLNPGSRGPYQRVIVNGAGDYRRFFLWLVEAAQAAGMIAEGAPVDVCDGAGIGYQRQQLATYLRGVMREDPLPVEASQKIAELEQAIGKLQAQARDVAEERAIAKISRRRAAARPKHQRETDAGEPLAYFPKGLALGQSGETKELRETFNRFHAEELERRAADIGFKERKIARIRAHHTKAAPPAVDFTAHKHPVAAVPCPDCHARAGAWCKRPSGHKAMDFHKSRKAEADRVHEEQGSPPIVRTADGWAYEAAENPRAVIGANGGPSIEEELEELVPVPPAAERIQAIANSSGLIGRSLLKTSGRRRRAHPDQLELEL
jgi:hypothetical protein